MTEIKLTMDDLKDDGGHVEAWNLREYADVLGSKGFSWVAALVRNIADQVEAQTPKPAVEEPTEFGSLIRATSKGLRCKWQRSPLNGTHYWQSEFGDVEVWSELTDVEVLRVGLGGPVDAIAADKDAFDAGFSACRSVVHQKLVAQLGQAITSERKNALEKAIQAVEELAP